MRFQFLLLWCLLAISSQCFAEEERFSLFVGANDGGADRVKLRYANRDAWQVAQVFQELGGVSQENLEVLEDASLDSLLNTIERFSQRLKQHPNARFFFYYSGHSNQKGLLLRDRLLPYEKLKKLIGDLSSRVKVIVLDSCASGSLIATKGGQRRPSYLKDLSSEIKGSAIITSSSADEYSQESAAIKGSFFTHYLVSGLRGAADLNSDRQISIDEVYRYAYQNTIQKTMGSGVGVQHPSYNFNLSGKGDLILSDLRRLSSQLVFGEKQGRFYIRSQKVGLVAEIDTGKSKSRRISLEPGRYVLTHEQGNFYYVAKIDLAQGAVKRVDQLEFTRHEKSEAVSRGDDMLYPEFYHVDTFSLSLWPQKRDPILFENNQKANVALALTVGYTPRVEGLALAPIGSIGEDLRGLMASPGFTYIFNHLQGVQLAGGFNYANSLSGLQLGPLNSGESVWGGQLGITNEAKKLNGGQIGIVNIGGQVKGFQLGLVNISDSVQGISIAPIIVVRNGIRRIETWFDYLGAVGMSLVTGAKYYYTAYHIGQVQSDLMYGISFGLRLPIGDQADLLFDTGFLRYRDLEIPGNIMILHIQNNRTRFGLSIAGKVIRYNFGISYDRFTFPHEDVQSDIEVWHTGKSIIEVEKALGTYLGIGYDL
ncbi:caspase family protein [Pseudobacteriovorax antillogorgiicola]|uniref:Caspase domain-containing protein n=1 Tax=Pseudobacteriovorax antillogorgiicola TaxID=1513793 RepID=A0A1Y6CL69_9BACT|nr:caspase family protein [Pseudobacteriovorax antillogorgiicola]TCS45672.1 caspase domain-containing protein [Pseudobacteriovorax antillogorgiicola]SMF73101.1 Caspase domain-containing protein [Pseudobacteriovorax antillogorgiicola]